MRTCSKVGEKKEPCRLAHLEVAVKNLAVVDMLEGQADLHKPVQDLVFGKGRRLLIVDLRIQIAWRKDKRWIEKRERGESRPAPPTAVAVVHDNGQRAVLLKGAAVGDNVRMLHRGQHLDLLARLFALAAAHLQRGNERTSKT